MRNAQVNALEAIAGLLEVMDAHSKSMALRVYWVKTYEADAKIAEILYKDVKGDHI